MSGVVGGLAFLVLIQAYELVGGIRIAWGNKLGVALVVAVSAAILSPVGARWVRGRNGQL